MSETATATHATGAVEELKKRPYVVVFVILAVVTLVELNVYSLGLPHVEAIVILVIRSEEHTSELQSRLHLVCRLLLEKKKKKDNTTYHVHGLATLIDSGPPVSSHPTTSS